MEPGPTLQFYNFYRSSEMIIFQGLNKLSTKYIIVGPGSLHAPSPSWWRWKRSWQNKFKINFYFFYGQHSVVAAWTNPSPWSILSFFFPLIAFHPLRDYPESFFLWPSYFDPIRRLAGQINFKYYCYGSWFSGLFSVSYSQRSVVTTWTNPSP